MNKKNMIISVIALIGIGAGVFLWMRKKKRDKYKALDLEAGQSTTGTSTSTFNPKTSAKKLEVAMKGWGTDEDMIWKTLEALTTPQRKKVTTYFNANYGKGSTLAEWFKGDLSGKDLTRALALIK